MYDVIQTKLIHAINNFMDYYCLFLTVKIPSNKKRKCLKITTKQCIKKDRTKYISNQLTKKKLNYKITNAIENSMYADF